MASRPIKYLSASLALVSFLLPAALLASSNPIYPPAISHVVGIVLENEDFSATFGAASLAPYLTRKGVLHERYYGTGPFGLRRSTGAHPIFR